MARGRRGSTGTQAPRTKTGRTRERHLPVRWSRAAANDLATIIRYLTQRSPSAGKAVLTDIRALAHSLAHFPRRGRVVPELARLGIDQWREPISAPYRLIYTIEPDAIEVDAVLDGRRDLDALLLERLVRPRGKV